MILSTINFKVNCCTLWNTTTNTKSSDLWINVKCNGCATLEEAEWKFNMFHISEVNRDQALKHIYDVFFPAFILPIYLTLYHHFY